MNQENKDIATTILQQLGGNRFITMTGAKNFIFNSEKKELAFKIGGTKNKANRICVSLNELDLYDMKFYKIYKDTCKEISASENLYHDQLETEFTKNTGLYTSL